MSQGTGEPAFNRGFADLDAASQPAVLIGQQDRLNAQAAFRAYKTRAFDLLELKPGDWVLDAGCGAGDDARALAEVVGPSGRVTGVDVSEIMLAQANARGEGLAPNIEFLTGDVNSLAFPDGVFSGARADRVLHHLDDPGRALAELARVVRPGGRVVVSEPDFGTFAIDHPDQELSNRILQVYATDGTRSGTIGRHLYALFHELGFVDVAVLPIPVLMTNFREAEDVMWLRPTVERAKATGAISASEGKGWLADLEEESAAGRFFAAGFGFTVGGRRPR